MDSDKGSAAHGLQLGKKPEDIHVLLVDDEKLSRVVVGHLLRKCNYQGTTFAGDDFTHWRPHGKNVFDQGPYDILVSRRQTVEVSLLGAAWLFSRQCKEILCGSQDCHIFFVIARSVCMQ